MKALLALIAALFRRAQPAERQVMQPIDAQPAARQGGDRFDACLIEVLKHEGGYVYHARDPGGATNKGITLATLRDWRRAAVTKADVMALTTAEAGQIYRARYWDAVKGDQLPPGVDLAVFDMAVNSGPGRAIRILQAALNVPIDGIIGPATLRAIQAEKPVTLILDICDRRIAFLKTLNTWPVFGKGWSNRVDGVCAAALKAAEVVQPA